MIRWPWTKHAPDPTELERARKAFVEAKATRPRTQRVAQATRDAIEANGFSHLLEATFGGRGS